MSGRHRTRGQMAQGGARVPLALGAVAVLVAITAITVRIVSANAAGCAGGIALHVAVTPEIASVLEEIGSEWTATKPQVAGKCVDLSIDGVPSPAVASSLTVYAGGGIDVAAAPQPTPSEDALPAIWIPDSTAWLTRVQTVDRAAFDVSPRSIASSPVVVAMARPTATAIGWPDRRLRVATVKPLLGSLKLGLAEPRRETASLVLTMLFGETLVVSDQDLPALVKLFRGVVKASSTGELLQTFGTRVNAGPASEQAILAYNADQPAVPLVAVELDPPGPVLDYPFAIRSGISRETAQAAELFRRAVLASSAAEKLAKKGFRAPDGKVRAGFPSTDATTTDQVEAVAVDDVARVRRALGLWSAANSPSRTLALFDVTSSMASLMRTASGQASRAQVMAAAAKGGLNLFTADSRLGMWTFGAKHTEVLPIDDLTAERKQELDRRMAGAAPTGSNRAELYATLLAAYKHMQNGYDPTRPNIIVVLTDGGDSNTSSLRQEEFNQALQQLADPTRPIRVVLIGISVGPADAANLQKIAEIVGGGFFPLTSPEQIQTIFLRALLRVGAA